MFTVYCLQRLKTKNNLNVCQQGDGEISVQYLYLEYYAAMKMSKLDPGTAMKYFK